MLLCYLNYYYNGIMGNVNNQYKSYSKLFTRRGKRKSNPGNNRYKDLVYGGSARAQPFCCLSW